MIRRRTALPHVSHPRRAAAGRTPYGLTLTLAAALCALAAVQPAAAASFVVPPDGRVVGTAARQAVVKPGETLLDIARRFDLGIDELAAANPGVDPWVPAPGTRVRVPSLFILPDAAHEGIVVNLPEMRLYYYPPAAQGPPRRVITFPLSIGAEGKTLPLGHTTIVEKLDHPTWVVPASILAEHRADGRPVSPTVPPGPDNPLGDYALRLGWRNYLIHGTNQPYSIGMRVSHGCLRLYPEDIARLYRLVAVGTAVRVVDQPFKADRYHGKVYLEAHAPLSDSPQHPPSDLTGAVSAVLAAAGGPLPDRAWDRLRHVALRERGIPQPLGEAAGGGAVRWYVQIGAYSRSASRRRAAEQAAALHWEPRTGAPPGDSLCRVYAGPYHDRGAAAAQRRRLQAATGIKGAVYPGSHYTGFLPCD